jgi:hypothetical protein
VKEFFEGEGYPIPKGFTEKDVDINAPLNILLHLKKSFVRKS